MDTMLWLVFLIVSLIAYIVNKFVNNRHFEEMQGRLNKECESEKRDASKIIDQTTLDDLIDQSNANLAKRRDEGEGPK